MRRNKGVTDQEDPVKKLQLLDKPQMRIPSKTVYLLGAGFSRPLGMPMMNGFVSEGLKLLKHECWKRSKAKTLEVLLDRMRLLLSKYHSFFLGSGKDEPSLEDLFCAVDLFSARIEGEEWRNEDRELLCDFVRQVCALALQDHEEKLEAARNNSDSNVLPTVAQAFFHTAARIACSDLNEKSPARLLPSSRDESCAYCAFLSQLYAAGIVAPRSLVTVAPDYACSAIISLNYDSVIESKAYTFGNKLRVFYGRDVVSDKCDKSDPHILYHKDDLSKWDLKADYKILPLIKLHGSLNWERAPSDLNDASNPLTGYQIVVKGAGHSMPQSSHQCLILPTWQRDLLDGTVFNTLFREARIHLRLASRIVIIGYSMPSTDRYLRYLLTDATNTSEMPHIEICNPGDSSRWRDRAREIFGSRLIDAKLTLREGFLEHVRANPDPNTAKLL